MVENMAGLTSGQLNDLRHKKHSLMSEYGESIFMQLWYTSSSQAYIQRSIQYDSTFLCKDNAEHSIYVDNLTLLLLYKTFQLEGIGYNFDSFRSVESVLTSEYSKKEHILLLDNKNGKASVFYAFNEKLRNSFAHGTFNILDDGTALFVGQAKAKKEGPMNFYLRIKEYRFVSMWQSLITKSEWQLENFQYYVYGLYFNIHNASISNIPSLYVRKDGSFLCFDNKFKFESVKCGKVSQDEQLKMHISKMIASGLPANREVYLFLSEPSNSGFEQTCSMYPFVRIITRDKLLNHFPIRII